MDQNMYMVNDNGKPICWSVWSLEEAGKTTLHAVTTTPRLASRYRLTLIEEDKQLNYSPMWLNKIRVWVEKIEMNHLFAEMFYQE